MLYKYDSNDNSISMLPSYDFEDLGGLEKDLENLLANNLTDLYSEDGQLMPIFQERSWKSEPDLCALDKDGNLIIFELKRGVATDDASIQVMGYCQRYGQKSYFELCSLYRTYKAKDDIDLRLAHAEAFGLENPLPIEEFNRKQKLVVIGCSSNYALMDAVSYWRNCGIDIDYVPYRFYKISDETYFEFFAKPYDYHVNVADNKGILFDTDKTHWPEAFADMFKNNKVSAYGGIKYCVSYFNKGDYVLYYHKGLGVIGAGIVKSSKPKEITDNDEMYMEVDFLTPRVEREEDLKYITVSELRELLNKNFYFAKTTKVPYLSVDESKKVVDLLLQKYNKTDTATAV